MGDFEEVERLQAGIREWLLRTARNGRQGLRGIPAEAVLALLCAAAFGPVLADAALTWREDSRAVRGVVPPGASAVAGIGVLTSVGASALSDVLAGAVDRARSGHPSGDPSRHDVQREVSLTLKEVLSARDTRAGEVRSDIAMVLREIDAGGTIVRAAIEADRHEWHHEVLTAAEAVSTEFGEMEFMLADLARAAGEFQDSLSGQGAELRAASQKVRRQAADIRMIREELAVIFQRTRRWMPGTGGRDDHGPRWTAGCPYRGLLPYDQAHEAVFFGRDRLTAQLAGALAETGILMVTGAPGAGKTSLLQAGLVPALARGVQVPGSSSWPTVSIIPADRPLTGLSARLAELCGRDPAAIRNSLAGVPGNAHDLTSEIVQAAAGREHNRRGQEAGPLDDASRLVLIIDQFEQIFATEDEEETLERTAFIEAVCAAATRPAGPRREPPALVVIAVRGDYWDRCAAHPQLAQAMQQDQLVVGPMSEADLRRVITGPAEASGLRLETGLVDTILADLRSAAEHGVTRAVLPLLSQAMLLTWEQRDGDRLTRGGYEGTGERVGVARAVEVSAEAAYGGLTDKQKAIARDVFRRMTALDPGRRAVRRPVTGGDLHTGRPQSERAQADMVLEAFARRHLLALHAGRAEIAHDVLLHAWPRLRGWLEQDQTSTILAGHLAEDTARWRASGRAMTRGRWRRRTLAGLLALLVIAALTTAGFAVKNARTTVDQQRTADMAQRLAAQSTALDATDPITASLLAGAAWRLAPTAQARYSLLESLAQPARGILAAPSGAVTALAYGPGGTTLAAGYSNGTLWLWDLATHRVISIATWGATPAALGFADGGKIVQTADPEAVGAWNPQAGHTARITALPLSGAANGSAVAFSPDGRIVATGGDDGTIRLWDTATGQEIGPPMSSDAKPVDAVTFSPDGSLVAAASTDGNIQLWSTATAQEAGPALVAGTTEVTALAFSPGGKILAAGGQDGAARLWDVTTGSQTGATMATGDAVSALAFGTGGTTLATAENDGSTELWNVATQTQTGASLTAQGSAGVSSLAFSPATDALATGNGDGTIRLWSPAAFHQPSAPLAIGTVGTPATAGPAAAVVSSGGTVLAASDGHGIVRVWDVATGQRIGAPVPGSRAATTLALSPDGGTLAVAGDGVQLWKTATGQRIGAALPPSGGNGPYGAVAFSPDGGTLATIGTDGTARLWDVATGQEIGGPLTVGGPGTFTGAVAFSPDGKDLATAGPGGQIRLWSVTAHQPLGQPMAAGAATTVLAFSPDGSILATAGGDGTARLWDVATHQEIGPPLTADTQPVYAVAFSPDGSILATAGGDGTARLWDVAFPANLMQAACAIADSSLTRQQWADYAGTQPFRQVCPAS